MNNIYSADSHSRQEAKIVQSSAFGFGFGSCNGKRAVFPGDVLNDYVEKIKQTKDNSFSLQRIEYADIFDGKKNYRLKEETIADTNEELLINVDYPHEKFFLGFINAIASDSVFVKAITSNSVPSEISFKVRYR